MKIIDKQNVVHWPWGVSATRMPVDGRKKYEGETRCSDPNVVKYMRFTPTEKRAVTCIECLALGPHEEALW